MKFTTFIFPCCLISLLLTIGEGRKCQPRNYGLSSVVCVCNATYCDDFDQITATEQGYLQVYTSSKDGLRFDRQTKKMDSCSHHKHNTGSTKLLQCRVNTKRTKQNIIGFGGAFTDSAGININSLSNATKANLMASYFSTQGIEYTLCRIPMGTTDFSTHLYTYQDDPNVPFSLAKEDYEYKIPLMKMANSMSTRGIRYFASPCWAPMWMISQNDNSSIDSANYQIWAEYFIKFIQAYKVNGVEIWAVSAQNEPLVGKYVNDRTSITSPFALSYTAIHLNDFVTNYLGPTLNSNNYTHVKLMMFDDLLLIFPIYNVALMRAHQPLCGKYVDGISFHWYQNENVNYASALSLAHEYCPNAFLMSTEASAGVFETISVNLGDWNNAEKYAMDIIKDLQNWVGGWMDWNLALDTNGGPNWINNFVDSSIIVNSTVDEFYKQPMFYALGHFSKFIPPGFRVVDVSCSGLVEFWMDESIQMTAAVKLHNDTINQVFYNFVLVVLNSGDESKIVDFDIQNDKVCFEVPAKSIQTYIFNI